MSKSAIETRYIFHYNGDLADEQAEEKEGLEEGEYTYHEHLTLEDGKPCTADMSEAWRGCDGRKMVDAFFDDGNELTVYEEELEAITNE